MSDALHPRPRGLTLFELLIAMTILAIAVGLAIPSLDTLLRDSQRTAAVNGFVHAIFLARSTALTRNKAVSICRSTDGLTCTHQTIDWQHGWMVFENADRDEPPVRDANETVLAVQHRWSGGTITSNRRSYTFRPHHHGVVNGTLVFCDHRGPTEARAVIISAVGRPRVSRRDSDNRPLRCPGG
ncbi:GspH/FimT family pseudopilin [Steroidobacter sp. S1-65]|uniref:Type II secretion system protein H n=1 Tax=Steroidobacter gossypii TaxID=2805490 RepID=A0ABS1X5X4_9GAMM|nr:GspH/FimT family pseudopilin [Steroidobacter gossypii]MBM0108627.1 GspH/FimT family pseudopilin [Steroidobacter gossypii]